MNRNTHCGYCAFISVPNTGKSTLLNAILGQKISITSHKPQTTRHRITGIKTTDTVQTIYVDTPGLHKQQRQCLNRSMNRAALYAIDMVDVIGFIVEAGRWRASDQAVLDRLHECTVPVILIVNKVDQLAQQAELIPWLDTYARKMDFAAVVPISALKNTNVSALEEVIAQHLPEEDFLYPREHKITYLSDTFLASELIREKLMRNLHQELPYHLTVEIETFQKKGTVLHISAVIWVERPGQKAIVIGKKGAQLKRVGQDARLAMERLFQSRVFLNVWVKVKADWSNDEASLMRFGYLD